MTTWECDTDSTGKTGDGSPRIKDPSSLTDSLALPLAFLVAFFDRVYSAFVCETYLQLILGQFYPKLEKLAKQFPH